MRWYLSQRVSIPTTMTREPEELPPPTPFIGGPERQSDPELRDPGILSRAQGRRSTDRATGCPHLQSFLLPLQRGRRENSTSTVLAFLEKARQDTHHNVYYVMLKHIKDQGFLNHSKTESCGWGFQARFPGGDRAGTGSTPF